MTIIVKVIEFVTDSNYKQKSLYGFRMSTLLGWFGGDTFKYVASAPDKMHFIAISCLF